MANKLPENEMKIYAALGVALTQWGLVEHTMSIAYCAAINDENHHPANASFWAVVSFEAKLKMVDAVISARFKHCPGVLGQWDTVRARLTEKNRKRNTLAHGSVVRMGYRNKKTKRHDTDVFFAPYFWARRATQVPSHTEMMAPGFDERPKERMYAKEINETAVGFRKIERRMWEICRRIRSQLRDEEGR